MLLRLINITFKTGQLPKYWKTAVLIPLLKKNKPKNASSSYMPISLTSCIGKSTPFTRFTAQRVYSHGHKCLSPTLHYTSVSYIHDIPSHQLFYSNVHGHNKNYEYKTRPGNICSTGDYYAHVPYRSTAIMAPELSEFSPICDQPIALLAS